MAENILSKFKQNIPASLSDEQIKEQVHCVLDGIDTIYSYLIYTKYDNNVLTGWDIEYMISQQDKYNTLVCANIVDEIFDTILSNKLVVKNVIGYRQPPLELMLTLYKPLIKKLALEQSKRWLSLEYEDAYSMCQLVMIILYNKGYYIHKRLLERSFNNYVLMELRHERDKPDIISLDKIVYNDGQNEPLTISDMTPDKELEYEQELKEHKEWLDRVFNDVKEIIVEYIGERQFEQLLRDYGNKHTTTWSRKRMQQIKDRFKALGITWESFRRYL